MKKILMLCILLMFSGCTTRKAETNLDSSPTEEEIALAEERGAKVAEKLLQDSRKKQTLIMKAEVQQPDVYDTKIGGIPYLPKDFSYPCRKDPGHEQEPLILLAQFNFSQFPKNDYFPDHGILQIYISDLDAIYGMDYEDPTNDDAFRIIYFDSIEQDPSKLRKPPQLSISEDFVYPPDFSLKLSIKQQKYATLPEQEDYREEAKKAYEELYHEELDIDSHDAFYVFDGVYQNIGYTPSRLIKDPYYIQGDPRNVFESHHYDTVLALFQPDLDPSFMFGDGGCAVFMINKEKLKQADFTDVYYTWDCF